MWFFQKSNPTALINHAIFYKMQNKDATRNFSIRHSQKKLQGQEFHLHNLHDILYVWFTGQKKYLINHAYKTLRFLREMYCTLICKANVGNSWKSFKNLSKIVKNVENSKTIFAQKNSWNKKVISTRGKNPDIFSRKKPQRCEMTSSLIICADFHLPLSRYFLVLMAVN